MLKKNHQKSLTFTTRAFMLVLLFVCNAATAQTANEISNTDTSVIHLADPTIFHYKKTYYLYGTVEGAANNGFLVYTSPDLKSWTLSGSNNGFALRRGEAYGSNGFWAPQVFSYNKKFLHGLCSQ
jgi:beta-xylosidase